MLRIHDIVCAVLIWNRPKAIVRKHLFFLCDVDSMEGLIEKNPPISDEEMDSFLVGEDDLLSCTVQKFRIDFERPWKDNEFNRLAKSVFIKSLVAMYRSGEYSDLKVPEKLLDDRVVGAVLDNHMEYRRRLYRQNAKPPSKEDKEKLKKRKAMNARRSTVC